MYHYSKPFRHNCISVFSVGPASDCSCCLDTTECLFYIIDVNSSFENNLPIIYIVSIQYRYSFERDVMCEYMLWNNMEIS